MMRMMSLALAACLLSACGSSSPSAPSSGSTPPSSAPPVATTLTLSGIVNSAAGGPVVGALVVIQDGPNVGKSATTDGGGTYTFSSLTASSFTVIVTAANFVGVGRTLALSGNQTSSFSLLPSKLFSSNGTGDNLFTIPSYVTRIRIDATYGGSCQNFIVHLSTTPISLVNIIIGTCSVADTHSPFSGTYSLGNGGGQITITGSTGVAWTFTEVR